MTLYLKYRPQTIDELDLESVRSELKKIVKSGNIPHAFLFAGPKGTGKTSAARVMAKIVNCEKRKRGQIEPCNKCSQCVSITKGENIDVVELDAASHRGIDDIRTLRDAVKLAPASAKRKVYIIDEAHMLTTEASNALLKTLEEPPEHVMFILATTNPEKLIETIRSRTVLVRFNKAKDEEILRSLRKKVKGEKLEVEDGALEVIAKLSDFSFRDADKILEQLSLEGKITKEKAQDYLFKVGTFDPLDFIRILTERDTKAALNMIKKTIDSGGSAKSILEAVITRLRSALLFKVEVGGEDLKDLKKQEIISLIKLFSRALSEIPMSYLEQISIEIAVVEWCDKNGDDMEEKKDGNTFSKDKLRKNSSTKKNENKQEKTDQNLEAIQSTVVGSRIDDGLWKKILAEVRPKNTSTEALLRAARPLNFDQGTLTLEVFYSFHKERLEANPHRDILEEVSGLILGSPVKLVCRLTKPSEKTNNKKTISTSRSALTASKVNSDSPDVVLTESESVLTEAEDGDIINAAKEIFGSD